MPIFQMGDTGLAHKVSRLSSELSEAAELFGVLATNKRLVSLIEEVSNVCAEALRNGKRIIFAGNGGSAADAQHFAAELVGRFYFERSALPSLALNTDTSMLTAIGNDYGFEYIFTRQLEANGTAGDVFVSLSTSGCSANINHAIRHCKDAGLITVGLSGKSGGEMAQICDYSIIAPSESTPRIQEAHTLIGHAICAEIEHQLFSQKDES